MSLPLTRTPEQTALADSVRRYCTAHCTDTVQRGEGDAFPWEFWRGLAELGVLALAVPGEGGGAGEIAAASTELGRAAAPGPLAGTVFATHALPADSAAAVARGSTLAACGAPPLLPWAPFAGVFVETDGARAWSAYPAGAVEPVRTLGGEPWGRVELRRGEPLERAAGATALTHVALAAYLCGAGRRLLDATAEHARTRVQFGRTLDTFQAVAHPVVDAGLGLTASEKLLAMSAAALDRAHRDAGAMAAAARLSASGAAVEAAFVAHQVHGALGYTVEGPVGHVAQRIRRLATLPGHAETWREQALARYYGKVGNGGHTG